MDQAYDAMVAENHYMRLFRKAGAHSPETARPLGEIRVADDDIFREMVGDGTFVETPDGRWYMPRGAAKSFVRRRFLVAVLCAAVIIGAIVAIVLLFV
jgi:hypothetical protein